MAISLQEQLLKAGVASKKQANKAKADKRKGKASKVVADDSKTELQTQKKEQDRQLNLAREKDKADKAAIAQARQIVESNKVTISRDADISHQFAHSKFVKTLYVTAPIQQQLFRGQLAIISMDDKYWLVPRDQAERLQSIQPEWIVQMPEKEIVAEDDPYADYQVPDDLMW